jgi:hypothetical protein
MWVKCGAEQLLAEQGLCEAIHVGGGGVGVAGRGADEQRVVDVVNAFAGREFDVGAGDALVGEALRLGVEVGAAHTRRSEDALADVVVIGLSGRLRHDRAEQVVARVAVLLAGAGREGELLLSDDRGGPIHDLFGAGGRSRPGERRPSGRGSIVGSKSCLITFLQAAEIALTSTGVCTDDRQPIVGAYTIHMSRPG